MLIVGSSTAINRAADLVTGEKLLEVRDHRRRLGNAVLVAFNASESPA
jgi:hypothetical protein